MTVASAMYLDSGSAKSGGAKSLNDLLPLLATAVGLSSAQFDQGVPDYRLKYEASGSSPTYAAADLRPDPSVAELRLAMVEFADDFIAKQKELDPSAARIFEENIEDLYS